MNPSSRLLWLLGAIVCVAVLAAACSSPSPSATEELLLPASGGTPSPDQPSATPAGATQPPPVATSALPAPSPTRAEPLGTGGREIRLTPVGTLIPEPVPTLGGKAVTGEVPGDLLKAILGDAADRAGLPPEAFTVLRAEAVTWNDGSLGCPQPGMAYAQVLTPGFQVILEGGGQVYEYHTGTIGPIVLCREEGSTMEDSLVPGTVEPAGAVAPGLEALVEQAREDLAQRLSVLPEQITVLEAKAVVWPDSSLGCPQPGMAYAEVLTPGFLVLLSANGQEYEYHTSRGTELVYCENPSLPIPGTPDDF